MLLFEKENLVPEEWEQEAILCWNGCNAAVAYTHLFLKYLLVGTSCNTMLCPMIAQTNVAKGLCTEIQEVLIEVKNEHLKIIDDTDCRDPNRFRLSHTVLRVCLNTGEAYCLDLAGAQYRWYVCLVLKTP